MPAPDPDPIPAPSPAAAPSAAELSIREATPADVGLLLEMFWELARYENLEHEMKATEELLAEALFGHRPAAQALIAERGGQPAGYALFYLTFSTFLAIQGIWLEDLYVRPAHRRGGSGRALLAAVAAHLQARGGHRLEWSALKWNELALGFYRGLGAETMDEWITHRLTGEQLDSLAAEASTAG